MEENGNKKKRLVAIAAAGAVVILIASSAVRCAVTGGSGDAAHTQETAAEQPVSPAGEGTEPGRDRVEGDGGSMSSAGVQPASQTPVYDRCRTIAWVSPDDGGTTLEFSDSVITERSAGGKLTSLPFTSIDEALTGDQALLTVWTDGGSATVVVGMKDGQPVTVKSDAFGLSQTYGARAAGGGAALEVANVNDGYLALVGDDGASLEEAIAGYAAAHYPQATVASFDGEVYLDMNKETVSATFHLNDPASTVLAVTWADGAFAVLG